MEKLEPPPLPEEEIDFENREGIDEENAVPICICCMAEIPHDQVLFCPDCGAPIDPLATLLYFENTLAEGYILREALSRPRNRITLIGAIFFIGPVSVAVAGFAFTLASFNSGLSFLVIALSTLIPFVLLNRCIRSYQEFKKKAKT